VAAASASENIFFSVGGLRQGLLSTFMISETSIDKIG